MAIIDLFDRGWRANPHGSAYIQDDRHASTTAKCANYPAASPMPCSPPAPASTKGAVWATNDVTAWTCTLGLWRANMTWLPVGARNAPEENHHVLDAFDCEVLFFQQYFAPVIAELQARLPKIKLWVCVDGEPAELPQAVSRCRPGLPISQPVPPR